MWHTDTASFASLVYTYKNSEGTVINELKNYFLVLLLILTAKKSNLEGPDHVGMPV